MSPLGILKLVFGAVLTINLARYALSGHLKEDFAIFRGHRLGVWLKLIFSNIAILVVTIAFAIAIYNVGPTILHWSWLMLLAQPGETAGGNLNVAAAEIPYFGLIFLALLFVNLPSLARWEEETFREGTRSWAHALPRSVLFGLMHCLVGVPLFAGLALALPGLWFTAHYFKGGVERATLFHSVYNMILVLALFCFVALATGVNRG
jgi:hypothetical protein